MNYLKHTYLIIFCSIAFVAKAQNLNKLIDRTNEYMSIYDTLSPWHGNYAIKDFDFTEEELTTADGEKLTYNDSIDPYTVIDIYQSRILDNIDKIAHHKDFPKQGSELFLASPDNKLFNFALFENTGGSYKSYISFMYYIENDKIVYYGNNRDESRNSENFEFNTDGYEQIDTIQTKNGVKYLLQGSVVGCNTCLREYITLVRFEGGKPVCDFSYQLNTRFGSSQQFDYDAETKTITIAYETDDHTSDCYCEQECDDKDTYRGNSSYYENGTPKDCRCVFVFNGETFELTEECWQKKFLKENDDETVLLNYDERE
jgi:hypothetical protein